MYCYFLREKILLQLAKQADHKKIVSFLSKVGIISIEEDHTSQLAQMDKRLDQTMNRSTNLLIRIAELEEKAKVKPGQYDINGRLLR